MNCTQCGVCCKLFLINLNEKEYNSNQYKTIFEEFGIVAFKEAELTGANILAQNEDESCIYLKDKKCSIHKNRPQCCQNFFCDSKDPWFKEMIDRIDKEKTSFLLLNVSSKQHPNRETIQKYQSCQN